MSRRLAVEMRSRMTIMRSSRQDRTSSRRSESTRSPNLREKVPLSMFSAHTVAVHRIEQVIVNRVGVQVSVLALARKSWQAKMRVDAERVGVHLAHL